MNPVLPEVLQVTRKSELELCLKLRLLPELWHFQGHFPEFAILPAVAQLDWALHFARALLGVSVTFRGMDRLKFRQVLRPHDEPELVLELRPQRGELEFRYSSERGRHSSGQLQIGEPTLREAST